MRAIILRVMCLTIAIISFVAIVPGARAEPSNPVRIIAITKENAERSAAALAASRSPFIGMPPRSRVIRTEPDWRNARAAMPVSETSDAVDPDQKKLAPMQSVAASSAESDRVQVTIIKHGKSGGGVVEVHIVGRHGAGR